MLVASVKLELAYARYDRSEADGPPASLPGSAVHAHPKSPVETQSSRGLDSAPRGSSIGIEFLAAFHTRSRTRDHWQTDADCDLALETVGPPGVGDEPDARFQ
jgi:hypothetical protein